MSVFNLPDPSNVTPEQRKIAQAQMVNLSQQPDVQDKLARDVKNAADASASIAQSFVDIGTKLQSIDNLDLQSDKFFPHWKEFRDVRPFQRFTSILSYCRTATF